MTGESRKNSLFNDRKTRKMARKGENRDRDREPRGKSNGKSTALDEMFVRMKVGEEIERRKENVFIRAEITGC